MPSRPVKRAASPSPVRTRRQRQKLEDEVPAKPVTRRTRHSVDHSIDQPIVEPSHQLSTRSNRRKPVEKTIVVEEPVERRGRSKKPVESDSETDRDDIEDQPLSERVEQQPADESSSPSSPPIDEPEKPSKKSTNSELVNQSTSQKAEKIAVKKPVRQATRVTKQAEEKSSVQPDSQSSSQSSNQQYSEDDEWHVPDYECSRCHHRFLLQSKLEIHKNKKDKCKSHQTISQSTRTRVTRSAVPVSDDMSSNQPLTRTSSLSGSQSNTRWHKLDQPIHVNNQTNNQSDNQNIPSEFVCTANDVISIKFIRSLSEIGPEYGTIHPLFTHQLFDGEEIIGFKKLEIKMFYLFDTLDVYIKLDWEERLPDRTVEDLLNKLISQIEPSSIHKSIKSFTAAFEKSSSFHPPGVKCFEYSIPSVDTKDTFMYEVYQGRLIDRLMNEYHCRIQFFLLLFIDRSSFINDADPEWEIVLLFEKKSARSNQSINFSFVGYVTLYKFFDGANYCQNFLSSNQSMKYKLRLSQILVIPPFQRQGHGARLLEYVYHYADQPIIEPDQSINHLLNQSTSPIVLQPLSNQSSYSEVNVEDPAPGFQALRDLIDLQRCKREGFYIRSSNQTIKQSNNPLTQTIADPIDTFDAAYAHMVSKKLHITQQQTRRCYEMMKLAQTDVRNIRLMERYRVELRARLANTNMQDLMVKHSGTDRKHTLDEMQHHIEQYYHTVIRKARVH